MTAVFARSAEYNAVLLYILMHNSMSINLDISVCLASSCDYYKWKHLIWVLGFSLKDVVIPPPQMDLQPGLTAD